MTSQQDQEYGSRWPDDRTGMPADMTAVDGASGPALVPSDDDLMERDGDPALPGDVDPTIVPEVADDPSKKSASADQIGSVDLTQWHDIQARFVDDPRGSVQLAAQAAEEALGVLIASLRERQSALTPVTADSSGDQDTERLRGALRDYRVLCQNAEEIGRQITRL